MSELDLIGVFLVQLALFFMPLEVVSTCEHFLAGVANLHLFLHLSKQLANVIQFLALNSVVFQHLVLLLLVLAKGLQHPVDCLVVVVGSLLLLLSLLFLHLLEFVGKVGVHYLMLFVLLHCH